MSAVRALWVTNDFPPRSGGIEQFVANLLAHQDPDSVRVVTANHPEAADYDRELPYRVDRVAPRPLLPMPWLGARIRAEVADHSADVVVFGAAWPLAELAGAVPLPSVALTHGHEAGMSRVGAGLAVRHALRDVAAVGVISGYTAGLLEGWIPEHTAVHQIPPGVDVERFHPGVSGAGVRRRYGIAGDAPLALCLSRLVARKGQDVLIAAWPAIRAAMPAARLLIAGSGPLEPALRRDVTRLGLNDSVTFTGDVAATELPAFHAAADLFVMPCRTRYFGLDVEGLGIVYLEAQACGTPVVAGRSGGAPEAVVDGETGRVVDGRKATEVAAAVIELLGDPARRTAMGAAGREFVTANFAWGVIAERFEQMLRSVTGSVAAEIPPSNPGRRR